MRKQPWTNRMTMRHESGVALVVTLAVTLVVGLLVLASAVTGLIDRTLSANQLRSNAAYYVAQSGIDMYKTAIFRNLVDYYAAVGSGWCVNPVGDGVRDEDGILILRPSTPSNEFWTSWTPSGSGEFRVRLVVSNDYLVLTSEGRVGDALSTVQLVAAAGGGPASAWDNAILARGTTPGSNAINGNVTVYGPVHIVRGSIEGDLALGGTAGVFNTYRGSGAANSDITTAISNIVTTNVDLCSRIKIAEGDIYLESGAVQLGTSVDPIYSIHLGKGVVCGAKETNSGGCRSNAIMTDHVGDSSVYLRFPETGGITSPYNPFDLDLPRLRPEAFVRAYQTDDGTGVPVSGCEWMYVGGTVRLPPADPSATTSTCGDATNQIQWMAGSPGYLRIVGDINVPGADVEVVNTLLYEGMGALLVGSDLDDASARFTIGNGGSMRPRTPLSFPLGSAMAVLSTGDLYLGSTASNDPSAALLYAQHTFVAQKQVTLVGAVVAETFNLGNNVPKIAFHPDVRFAAQDLCLPGTACAGDGAPQNPGELADIAIERR